MGFMIYALINYLANNKQGMVAQDKLKEIYKDEIVYFKDITKVDEEAFASGLDEEDTLIVCGGDGTLNHFVNAVYNSKVPRKLFYLATGTGNDFAHDAKGMYESETELIPLHPFMKNLPKVTVNGKSSYFVNGVGFGLDGYCCAKGDDLREKTYKNVNYTNIAIEGLLFKYKPTKAKVTVDGISKSYEKVWLAPTMLGKYYGGGMMITPFQDRLNIKNTVSCAIWHNSDKVKTLMLFPKIFTGEHVKYTDVYDVLTGHSINVEFEEPQSLQIDGETINNVRSYCVSFN